MKTTKNKTSEQFLNIKNFTPYTPEPAEALLSGAAHLKSEDGQDWYACQQLFSADTLKITYDDNDVITCITRDISGLWPAGQSVAELPDTDENRRADISGGWQFTDGKIVQ
ncbi:tail fiber assembly protein, partial [Salmonella enterica subsp. arizonae serovar 44:z4,z23,z32:-]|nr:tail fiber assembly protein [Salmonella enterica subsp. arizonae serovar 44:z4,z23,z32:-]EGN3636668.1 tail fiber assembly protein [Salmonella enterica]EJE4399161.1 tail fiber assembly protein [Salmonella enterica]EKR2233051.1 tail fiber assembly protein [Salmonella enterica subsp. arizonae serovar 44:z4,z23,z32:-]HAF0693167.1 tail fiber assembly protein [Salmonella enterica subsp. arizonae serovar 44:z4,z23,z32:-]